MISTFKIWGAVVLFWAVLALGVTAHAEGTARLEIFANPSSPPARVWIDGRRQVNTPVSLPYFQAGLHTVLVSRKGTSIQRKVLIKPGVEILLTADFLRNEVQVKNRDALAYEPLQGKTEIVLTSPELEPEPPSAPPPKPEPVAPPPSEPPPAEKKPAVSKPEESKPPETTAPASIPGASVEQPETTPENDRLACNPDEWCALPREGEMGPPVPPEIREKIELKKQQEEETGRAWEAAEKKAAEEAERLAALEAERAARAADRTEPEAPTGPPPPCSRKAGADACKTHGSDVRGVVYSYYCYLAENDFESAYKLWITNRDLAWFFGVSKSFCQVSDYRIRGFQVTNSSPDTAEASYIVDLLGAGGVVIESWRMMTSLTSRGGSWRIRSVSGRLAPR